MAAVIEPACTYAQLSRDIEPVVAEWHDQVVPRDVELIADHRYSPRYAWMYAYEKRLKYRIEEARQEPLADLEQTLFGADGIFSEALSNAFVHGHRRDPGRAIEITCRVGRHGLVFSIRDSGDGFDVDQTMARMSAAGTYYSYAGNGLRALSTAEGVVASYTDRGRCLHLRILYPTGE
jgi:hypothetical protein